MESDASAASHTFTNPAVVLAKYYCEFLEVDDFVIIMKQLSFGVTEINKAIEEVMAFADKVKETDKSKSTKLETALPKLHKYITKLLNDEVKRGSGVSEFKFMIDASDLRHIPGHNHHLLTKTTDMMVNLVDFMSKSVEGICKNASKQQNKNGPQPVKSTDVPAPVNADKTPVSDSSTKKKEKKPAFTEVVKKAKNKATDRKKPKTTTTTVPKTVPAALKDIRLYIGIGDLDITEKRIRNWASGWKVHDNKLVVTKITQKSYVAEFQSRLRNFSVPLGVRCEKFKRKGPIIPYSKRKVASKLYISDVVEGISQDEVLEQIYAGFSNIDKSLSEIRPLSRMKAANSGNHCYTNRFWVKLVSQENGKPPVRLTDTPIPFKCMDWLGWRRKPKSTYVPNLKMGCKASPTSEVTKTSTAGYIYPGELLSHDEIRRMLKVRNEHGEVPRECWPAHLQQYRLPEYNNR